MTGLSVNAVALDDGMPYTISGNPIALGAGGLSASPSANDAGQGSPYLAVPLTLAAPQTWSVSGGSDLQQLRIAAPVTGSSNALTVNLTNEAFFGLNADAEVGAVSVIGDSAAGNPPSTLQLGDGASTPGSLNATDGNPISLSGGAKLVASAGATGPLTTNSSEIQVGSPGGGATMTVNGTVTLDSQTTLDLYLHRPGTRAGIDFTQLSATGNVNLADAQLDLGGLRYGGESPSCPALTPGDVDTIITTKGSITGQFAGVPDGATIPLDCPTTPVPTVKINYTAHTVTATVVTSDGIPTTTTLLATPTSPVTNQPVTLTATVASATPSVSPSGTLEFASNGTVIANCPVSFTRKGGTGTAACLLAGFAAVTSPETLTVTFRPADNSSFQGSTYTFNLAVGKSPTTTSVAVSDATPGVGSAVTYTATVMPDETGSTTPSGAIQFLDGGTPIGGCSSQPLLADASSSVGTCTVSYAAASSHHIAATYLADDNFTGSTSSPEGMTVTSPPTAATAATAATAPTAMTTIPTYAPWSSASAPRCNLTLPSHRVLLLPAKRGNARRGVLALHATCDQDAEVTLHGTVTRQLGKGTQRGKVFPLAAANASVTARRPDVLMLTLPATALRALQNGKETATVTLDARSAGGTTRVLLTVNSLKL